MATEVTEEDFAVVFSEDQSVVEIQYQGVNAALLASLQNDVNDIQAALDSALATVGGNLGTVGVAVAALDAEVDALSDGLAVETAARIAANTELGEAIEANNTALESADTAEIAARIAGDAVEAASRDAAIEAATTPISDSLDALSDQVAGFSSALANNTAAVINVSDALSAEVSAREDQYQEILDSLTDSSEGILAEMEARAATDEALQAQIDAATPVNYIVQTDADVSYDVLDFILGETIIGVRYVGAAVVRLPKDMPIEHIVSIKDETGVGNISITTH